MTFFPKNAKNDVFGGPKWPKMGSNFIVRLTEEFTGRGFGPGFWDVPPKWVHFWGHFWPLFETPTCQKYGGEQPNKCQNVSKKWSKKWPKNDPKIGFFKKWKKWKKGVKIVIFFVTQKWSFFKNQKFLVWKPQDSKSWKKGPKWPEISGGGKMVFGQNRPKYTIFGITPLPVGRKIFRGGPKCQNSVKKRVFWTIFWATFEQLCRYPWKPPLCM